MSSALDEYDEGFRRRAGVGVQHAKRITTWLSELNVGGELAGLISLRGYRKGQPFAFVPALHPQVGVCSTGVLTFNSNGFEGPGGSVQTLHLNDRLVLLGFG